jgi:hypothetical protein
MILGFSGLSWFWVYSVSTADDNTTTDWELECFYPLKCCYPLYYLVLVIFFTIPYSVVTVVQRMTTLQRMVL